ncbi:hypothetical protein D3Y57_14350 [Sphingomonas paeninsulae]|uniref:Uncharacterized protein n=1 Tax=Sphingomonas paeninsulae TaxID=2319844 RepID=A0A494THH1_SPHPE|nr:hypothetical protein D3Y57_14350 [Sphingomonas paeninsulae]
MRLTADKLVRGVSECHGLPYTEVEAALYNLPINLVGLFDSPQGVSTLGGFLAGLLGRANDVPYQITTH